MKSIQLTTYFTHSSTVCRCQPLLPLFDITLAFAKGGLALENSVLLLVTPTPLPPSMTHQPLVGQFSGFHDNTHLDSPQPAGLFWTSDQPDAETTT